ncbi:hypothetical protein TI39_contig4206g00012 [Zymoseptoria brevis]|uniref:Uncharacterized protein n=1 Tax=Zymoseptoria brevis TaxID=1047168 RepID=A0A0F4GDF4_9PEZI|nr:hypothetical protein TI39_contig4206g00012 [Zymoseptoria brevis]
MGIKLLSCATLVQRALSQAAQAHPDTFKSPPATSHSRDYSTNIVWELGTMKTVQWTTSMTESYGITLINELLGEIRSEAVGSIHQAPAGSVGLQSFEWNVSVPMPLLVPGVFYMALASSSDVDGVTSEYFNITLPASSTSSAASTPSVATTSSTASTSSVPSTSSFSSTSTSTSASTTQSTLASSSSISIANSGSTSTGGSEVVGQGGSGGEGNNTTAIGAGVGAGAAGALLLSLAAFLIWRSRSRSRKAAAAQTPAPVFTSDHGYYSQSRAAKHFDPYSTQGHTGWLNDPRELPAYQPYPQELPAHRA